MAAFADDTRLSKAIRGEATEEDMFLLSMDLHRVISWALANNMELNESKFDLLCYSYRPAAKLFRSFPFTLSLYEYETPSGTLINSTKCVRDLGVHMSSDYTWSAHISTIAEEGRKMLSWVLGIFQDRTRLTMLTLYKSMVRSKLEYCCPLWNPSSVAEMLKLERIQRIFTSKVEGCRELPYWERLKYLRIQSLQRRRERYIIIHTWKILNDLTNNHSPTVRTVPALVLLPALFHLYLVAFQQELLHCMSTPLLSKLLNSGTVCPQRLWTKMLLLYQHSRVHLALFLIRFQICHPLVSQE